MTLCAHGAHFLGWHATGPLAARARRWTAPLWATEVVPFLALLEPTIAVRKEMFTNLTDHPRTLVFPLVAVASLATMFALRRAGRWAHAFTASSLFIVGMLTTMAAGLYPAILPAHHGRPYSLTIDNAATGSHGLHAAIVWWPIGMVLAAAYFLFAYRMFFRAPALTVMGGEPSERSGG